ncbi:16218_t:CDS:2, partial [Funneliformis mosseae]
MSFNVAGSSTRVPSDLPLSDLSLPTVEEVKGFNVELLNGFLKRKLKNIDSHIDTLTAQEVDGEAFLTLTHEGLKVSGIPLGASTKIIKLLNDLQGEPPKKRVKIDGLNKFWRVLKDASYGERFLGKENGPSAVFIRKCYLDLQVSVFRRNKIRITGNPGIGKTYFGYYLLYLLALQNQTIVYDNANETKPIVFEGENAEYNDNIHPYLLKSSVWYIVDGKEPSDVDAKTILICSPKKSHYEHFDKYSGSTSRFMPIWKWSEIDTCRKIYKNIKKKQAVYLFRRWGGIPRFVLENANDITHQNRLEEAISCVKENIFDYVGESVVGADDISHKIAHIHPDQDDNEPYTRVTVRFASDYLRQRVTDQFEARIREKLVSQIRAGTGSSLLGISFEYISHKILRKGGPFDIRPLDSYEDPNYNDLSAVVNLPPQDKILRFNKKSIDSIEQRKFYQPKEKNFPSVDSIIAPNRVFQMTISKNHPISPAGLKLLCDKLGGTSGNGLIYYYFVVPKHLYDDFKLQRFDSKNTPAWIDRRVFQYVLKIEL